MSDKDQGKEKSRTRIFTTGSTLDYQDKPGGAGPRWKPEDEDTFLARVIEKATCAAREIIAKAMDEAAEIKQKARQEGYEDGMKDARVEIDKKIQTISESCGAKLQSINSERSKIFEERRQEIVALVKTAVEKTLHLVMDQEREKSLENLLAQALELIDTHNKLVIKVHPDDKDLAGELLNRAQARYPNLSNWTVKTDKSMQAGGVVVESEQGMVDNSGAARYQVIKDILDELTVNGEF